MEPETEGQDSTVMEYWSGSESRHSSEECYISESQDGSLYEERTSDIGPVGPWHPHIRQVDYPRTVEHPEPNLQTAIVEHQTPPSNYSSEETSPVRGLSPCSSQGIQQLSPVPCNVYPGKFRGSDSESYTSTNSTSPSKSPQGSDLNSGQISNQRSSSSSSIDQGEITLPLTHDPSRGNYRRLDSGPGARGNGSVESPEEGGYSEEPPAYVSFGISEQGAEQAEECDSPSERDRPIPSRHRERQARFSHNESKSERQVKEAKYKCKRIALLLTDAPNPRNRGVLMFKKRRQRVKKYTLISYGTGQNQFDDKGEDGQTNRITYAASNYSEYQEDYSVNVQNQDINLTWEIPNLLQHLEEMDYLPATKGKGVAMFAQRRQRMDEIALEHEEMRRKSLPVECMVEPEESNVHSNHIQSSDRNAEYMDTHGKHHLQHQENHQQEMQEYAEMINSLPNHQAGAIAKPLVSNRTAKPFLGIQNRAPVAFSTVSGVTSPVRHHDLKFKVPVPINTVPQVWSPTGDIIASRDERISIPAIKTGILPESKRRSTRAAMASAHPSNAYVENRGERKSYIEPGEEEDYFSLGAEACNFMQPRTIKHKNPPPVAPKPNINPACPPWLKERASNVPVGHSHQQSFPQQDWHVHQQMSNPMSRPQTQAQPQPPMNTWTTNYSTSPSQLQPTRNSWSPQPSRSPVSIQVLNPTHPATGQPAVSQHKSPNASVTSCPPLRFNSYRHAAKATPTSPMGQVSEGHVSLSGDGPILGGKGAELFAKRQTRMEKFVVDAETVQANKAKSPSPTASLPETWRYSRNVRAPPPLSYDPLHAPFYPSAAVKQPPSTCPKPKLKTKAKAKVPLPKHLDALNVIKHHPYQLDSSLFTYNVATEVEGLSPKPKMSPIPTPELSHNISPSPVPVPSPRPAPVTSPYATHELSSTNQPSKPIVPAKSTESVSVLTPFLCQATQSTDPLPFSKQLHWKANASTAVHDNSNKALHAPIAYSPLQTSTHHEPYLNVNSSLLSSVPFNAEFLSRGTIQMAPRPKFSAKKQEITKLWKPVILQH
ncbi:hypothetical protein UPYG_G00041270 [Umbra pygmaea]|uniref:Synaptopodin n=1 Tax=Umbra pygmaea TaxID=75934 RepID=A0ABD0Y5N2_UMBPY